MTMQYTTTQQLLPSNVMAESLSSKVDANKKVDSDIFSNVLDKASKDYTDKREVKDYASKEDNSYASKTKCAKNVKDTSDKESSLSVIKTSENTQDVACCDKPKSKDELQNLVDDTIESEVVDLKEVEPDKIHELRNELDVNKSVEQLLDEIKLSAKEMIDKAVNLVQDNQESASLKTSISNKMVLEQVVSNVEFDNLDLKNIDLDGIKNLDVESLQKLVKQTQVDVNTVLTQVDVQPKVDVALNSGAKASDIDLKVDSLIVKNDVGENLVQNNNLGKDVIVSNDNSNMITNKVLFDSSKLTANIEGLTKNEIDASVEKVISPLDTKSDIKADIQEQIETTPRIKVTEEVISQIKDAVSKNVENKDNASFAKAKAVETMTSLQDTNTVLTESNSSGLENGNNSGLGQNNANETAVKLTVEANSFNSTVVQPTETFINRLDAQLATREVSNIQNPSLTQTDILSQVSAKFEQLQQQAGSKVSIVLQPESLGRVSVEIMNSKDGIVAKMTTETQQVKELFDKNIESLKSSLSAQGVNVNNIKVECTHESTNNAMNFERDQFNQSFNNQQQGQNQANKSDQTLFESFATDFENDNEDLTNGNSLNELKNTESIIKHNGKVDYSV